MILTFTDFGLEGPYMGQMRAKLLQLAPQIPIIDLMVDVPAFDVDSASLLLAGIVEDMPVGGIYLCVVDPGVGGARKPICVKCGERWFVGPDNGLFHHVMQASSTVEAYEILWRPDKLSNSFHGRDLFAPVAAMLATEQSFEKQSVEEKDLCWLATAETQVIYTDRYGNCWTSLRANQMGQGENLIINKQKISYASVFCDTEPGQAFWYYNSSGFVEIAINQGNAAHMLDLKAGSPLNRD